MIYMRQMQTRRTTNPFTHQPEEILLQIIAHLDDPKDLRRLRCVSKEWKRLAKESGAECYLVGETPRNWHAGFLGVYVLYPKLIHHRFAYYMAQDPGKMIWYAGAKERCWFAGIASELGESRGRLLVEGDARVPWQCTSTWEVSRNREVIWEPAPRVRCATDLFAEEAARELDERARADEVRGSAHIELRCRDRSELAPRHENFMGSYKRIKEWEKVNFRPAYRKDDNEELALWYDGRCWVAGFTENLGLDMGYVVAQDDSMVPENVAVPWQVNDEAGLWPIANSLECRVPRQNARGKSSQTSISVPKAKRQGHLQHDARSTYNRRRT